eukprot:jgi/Tetstr1/459135/TSEL_004582.t1
MKPLLGAGGNSLEGAVILKHLSSSLGFNASGFGIVEVGVGSHCVTCLSGRSLPVLAQEVANILFPLRPEPGESCRRSISSKSSSRFFQLSRSTGEKCHWTDRFVMYDLAFLKSSKYLWNFNVSGLFLSQRAYKRGRPARISGVPAGALFKICTGSERGVLDHKAVRNEPPDAAASSRMKSNLTLTKPWSFGDAMVPASGSDTALLR